MEGPSRAGAWPFCTFPPHLSTSPAQDASHLPCVECVLLSGYAPTEGASRLFVVSMCLCLKPDRRQQPEPWHPGLYLEQA